jgi:2-dehydro-3-deoxyphosphogalactonate aldolase
VDVPVNPDELPRAFIMTAPASKELLAIVRGLTSDRASDVAALLIDCGFRTIEVPLNSPNPLETIRILADKYSATCLIGAGTVLTSADVDSVHSAGGRVIVSPNCDGSVICRALELGMRVLPGVASASEAFAALRFGAMELKLFPASTYGSAHLKALRSVLPPQVKVFPVGGIGARDIPEWLAAGADGFGFGGELFRPHYSANEIRNRAMNLMRALREAIA